MSVIIDALQSNRRNHKVTLLEMTGYGTGFFGYGFITQMITSYFVFYATVLLKLPGSIVGLVFALSVIWDAVSDPIMGYLSDHTYSRYGKRHLYIVIGTIGIVFSNLILWQVSANATDLVKFLWILSSIMVIKTFITIFITPYNALGAELSNDYHERSKIQGIKTVYFLIALVIVTAVCMFVFFKPTPLYPIGQLNPLAYRNIAVMSSIIMLITGIVTHMSTKRFIDFGEHAVDIRSTLSLGNFIRESKYSLQDKDFRHVFFGYMYTNLASAIVSVVGLHTFTYTFNMSNYEIGIIFGVQFFFSIASQPFWIALARKIDKKRAVITGLKVCMTACLILFFFVIQMDLIHVNFLYLLIYAIIVGFGTSGLFSIPLSMLADTVDQQEFNTGNRNEGVYFGMLNFGYKFSQSLAVLILGVVLDLIRFDSNLPVQGRTTLFLLGTLLSLGGLLAFVLSSISYKNYSIDENRVREMQISILRRKH
ncbi:MAG: MFS transporter [Bacillota bacterium]|nr:MFS transporter [Bacillota bacterium]